MHPRSHIEKATSIRCVYLKEKGNNFLEHRGKEPDEREILLEKEGILSGNIRLFCIKGEMQRTPKNVGFPV